MDASLQQHAEQELGETPQRRSAAITELHALVSDSNAPGVEPLRSELLQHDTLLIYLRCRKFDVQKAFKCILARAQFHHDHPDLTTDLRASEFEGIYAKGLVRVLHGTDRAGRRVVCLRPCDLHCIAVDPTVLRWVVYVMTTLSRDPTFQVLGVVIVYNFDRLTLGDALHMAGLVRHGRAGLLFHYIRDCAPVRVGGLYWMHQPVFVSIVWALVSRLLGKKLRSRVHFFGGKWDRLHEYVAPQVLPPEWGGTLVEADPLSWLRQQAELEGSTLQCRVDGSGGAGCIAVVPPPS